MTGIELHGNPQVDREITFQPVISGWRFSELVFELSLGKYMEVSCLAKSSQELKFLLVFRASYKRWEEPKYDILNLEETYKNTQVVLDTRAAILWTPGMNFNGPRTVPPSFAFLVFESPWKFEYRDSDVGISISGHRAPIFRALGMTSDGLWTVPPSWVFLKFKSP